VAINKVEINGDKAAIAIGSITREFEVKWIDSHPKLIDCSIGIKIGANGQKVWDVPAAIKRNKYYGRVRQPEWVLAPAYMPLNSVNKGFCAVREIVCFADLIPVNDRSGR
jgi:hypothetical protein